MKSGRFMSDSDRMKPISLRNFTKLERFVSQWVQEDRGKHRESHQTLSWVSFTGKQVLFCQQDTGNWQESKSRYEKSSRIYAESHKGKNFMFFCEITVAVDCNCLQ